MEEKEEKENLTDGFSPEGEAKFQKRGGWVVDENHKGPIKAALEADSPDSIKRKKK